MTRSPHRILGFVDMHKLVAEMNGEPYVPLPPPPKEPTIRIVRAVPRAPHPNTDDWPRLGEVGAKKKLAMCEAQNHRCAYCGIGVEYATARRVWHNTATVDHVTPRVNRGRSIWSNEVIACMLCNNGRGALDAMVYFEKVQELGRDAAARWGWIAQSIADRGG